MAVILRSQSADKRPFLNKVVKGDLSSYLIKSYSPLPPSFSPSNSTRWNQFHFPERHNVRLNSFSCLYGRILFASLSLSLFAYHQCVARQMRLCMNRSTLMFYAHISGSLCESFNECCKREKERERGKHWKDFESFSLLVYGKLMRGGLWEENFESIFMFFFASSSSQPSPLTHSLALLLYIHIFRLCEIIWNATIRNFSSSFLFSTQFSLPLRSALSLSYECCQQQATSWMNFLLSRGERRATKWSQRCSKRLLIASENFFIVIFFNFLFILSSSLHATLVLGKRHIQHAANSIHLI